jgi:hypothetical protein
MPRRTSSPAGPSPAVASARCGCGCWARSRWSPTTAPSTPSAAATSASSSPWSQPPAARSSPWTAWSTPCGPTALPARPCRRCGPTPPACDTSSVRRWSPRPPATRCGGRVATTSWTPPPSSSPCRASARRRRTTPVTPWRRWTGPCRCGGGRRSATWGRAQRCAPPPSAWNRCVARPGGRGPPPWSRPIARPRPQPRPRRSSPRTRSTRRPGPSSSTPSTRQVTPPRRCGPTSGRRPRWRTRASSRAPASAAPRQRRSQVPCRHPARR